MHKILNHKITLIISAIAFIAAIVAGVYAFVPAKKTFSAVEVTTRDIVESISVSGKIDSDKHVALSFGKPGTVSSVSVVVGQSVKAGDILATLKADDLRASLQGAQADVVMQQANLSSLVKGTRPEQLAINEQSVNTTKLALDASVKDAYLKSVDALRNKIDILFTDGSTVNPQIKIHTESDTTEKRLENNRVAATQKLNAWTSDALGARSVLSFIKSFIDDLESQVNLLTPENSGYSQDSVNAFITAANSASAEVNGALTSLNAADQAYKTASDQLNLATASSTSDTLIAQQAVVARTQANVSNIQSQIGNTIIKAPFDGVVASIVPKVGQDVAAYSPAIDLISGGVYKIEVEIPETDIAKVSEGSTAVISLDAYGPGKTIAAHVGSIDLSQTVENGVGFYKAVVYLDETDARVRTDMTGRVIISGRKVESTLAVPTSALIKKNGQTVVLVEDASNNFAETSVETGISGEGFTQIVSGLSAGAHIASFGINN